MLYSEDREYSQEDSHKIKLFLLTLKYNGL